MTPTELHRADWVHFPFPIPDEQEELMAPWTTENPRRILVCVKTNQGVLVIARTPAGAVVECWKVMEVKK